MQTKKPKYAQKYETKIAKYAVKMQNIHFFLNFLFFAETWSDCNNLAKPGTVTCL